MEATSVELQEREQMMADLGESLLNDNNTAAST